MSVREYIGARYVPLFADPLTWDATRTYEPLTVVLYQGNSYTSRQAVPTNIDITNTTYWAQTGNYNAQIEQYRAEVQAFDSRIKANANAISDEETARQNADSALQAAIDAEETARQNADTQLSDDIAAEATARQNAINAEATARQNADTQLSDDIAAEATARQNAINAEATARQNADNSLQQQIATSHEKNLLLFGDSWTDVNTQYAKWMPYVTNELRFANVYNYAVSGSGWTLTSDIATQIATAAKALTTEQKSKITHIIAFACVNDLRTLSSDEAFVTKANDIKNSMISAYNSLRATYTNAKIYFIPNCCGSAYNNSQNGFKYCMCFNKYMECGNNSLDNDIPYVGGFMQNFIQFNDDQIFLDTPLHLNAAGAKVIGTLIKNVLKGIPLVFEKSTKLAANSFNGLTGDIGLNIKSNYSMCVFGTFTGVTTGTHHFSPGLSSCIMKMLIAIQCRRDGYTFKNLIGILCDGSGNSKGVSLFGASRITVICNTANSETTFMTVTV